MRAILLSSIIIHFAVIRALSADTAETVAIRASAARIATVASGRWAEYWRMKATKPELPAPVAPGPAVNIPYFPPNFIFNAVTGRIDEIQNGYLFKQSTRELPAVDVPKWDKVEALRIAREFVTAAIGVFPDDLGAPAINFYSQQSNGRRFYSGRWHVRWPKVSPEGYPYSGMSGGERLLVIMDETCGPLTMLNESKGKCDPISFTPISALEGFNAGEKRAKSLGPRMGSNFKITQGPTGRLEIVTPNEFDRTKSTSGETREKPRLAWVVSVAWTMTRDGQPVEGPTRYGSTPRTWTTSAAICSGGKRLKRPLAPPSFAQIKTSSPAVILARARATISDGKSARALVRISLSETDG